MRTFGRRGNCLVWSDYGWLQTEAPAPRKNKSGWSDLNRRPPRADSFGFERRERRERWFHTRWGKAESALLQATCKRCGCTFSSFVQPGHLAANEYFGRLCFLACSLHIAVREPCRRTVNEMQSDPVQVLVRLFGHLVPGPPEYRYPPLR